MAEVPVSPLHVSRRVFDPAPELAELRAERPVTRVQLPWGGDAWLVTRYEDVRMVLSDGARFSNAGISTPLLSPEDNGAASEPAGTASRAAVGKAAGDGAGSDTAESPKHGFLLAYDPPDHTRLRRLLMPAFTVKRMRQLQPRIEAIVADRLDAMQRNGPPSDLVPDFALPVPSLVICELLGVPYADRDLFQEHSSTRIDMSRDMAERQAAVHASKAYMADLVAQQRRSPGENLLGRLIEEHGDTLDDIELTGVADLLLFAGHETTANMLGLGTLLLLRNPDQLALVRDGDAIDTAVDELLRYLTIVHSGMPRTARENVELDGQVIKAGDAVVCSLPAANRDPSLAADAERFDLARKVAAHVAFGHGVHHCLGAPLARLELQIAYPALFRRFPGLRLAVPFEDVPFKTHSAVYGVESLPITW